MIKNSISENASLVLTSKIFSIHHILIVILPSEYFILYKNSSKVEGVAIPIGIS